MLNKYLHTYISILMNMPVRSNSSNFKSTRNGTFTNMTKNVLRRPIVFKTTMVRKIIENYPKRGR